MLSSHNLGTRQLPRLRDNVYDAHCSAGYTTTKHDLRSSKVAPLTFLVESGNLSHSIFTRLSSSISCPPQTRLRRPGSSFRYSPVITGPPAITGGERESLDTMKVPQTGMTRRLQQSLLRRDRRHEASPQSTMTTSLPPAARHVLCRIRRA